MKVKVNFVAVNQGSHGAPRTILSRIYENGEKAGVLPKVDDELLIQWGQDKAQSGIYRVKKIGHEFWADEDVLTYQVASIG